MNAHIESRYAIVTPATTKKYVTISVIDRMPDQPDRVVVAVFTGEDAHREAILDATRRNAEWVARAREMGKRGMRRQRCAHERWAWIHEGLN